jgi:hypothetical protein
MLKKLFSIRPLQFRAVYAQRSFSTGWDNSGKVSWTQAMKEEAATNEFVNPYYNPRAVGLKKELEGMQVEIKEWQNNFKKKNGRKPTLEEMRQDPSVGPLILSLDAQKNAIKASIQRFRFN